MQLDATSGTLIGTVIGALAGISGTIAVALISKRSEEKRHFRELAMQAAIQNWQHSYEVAKAWSEAGHRKRIAPLDHYIIHMILLCKLLDERELSEENVRVQFKRIHSILRAVRDEIPTKDEKENPNT